jgi:hypothetical protein
METVMYLLITKQTLKQEKQYKYEHNIEARSPKHCCCGKAKLLNVLSVS